MDEKLEKLQSRLGKYIYDLETEDRLTRVGLNKESNLAAVQEKYADLFTKESVSQAKKLYDQAENGQKDLTKRVYVTLQDSYVYHQLAAENDKLTTKLLKKVVKVGGEELPYFSLQPAWDKEPDFDKREALYDAALSVHKEIMPDRQKLLTKSLTVLRDEFNEPDYIAYTERIKDFSYEPFREMLLGLAKDLEPTYEQAMGDRSKKIFGKGLGTCRAVQASYVLRFREHDNVFPQAKLLPVAKRTFASLGIDLNKQKNIHIDAEDRPNKNPRAVCYPSDPPKEIHLIIKPVGGVYDYEAFLHEAGHALHFGLEDPSLPLAFRLLDTSNALTEVYSYLFEHLVYDPNWLIWAFDMPEAKAKEVARDTRIGNLFMFMRYVGKLDYELEFFRDPTNWKRNAALYADKLTAATKFTYPEGNFLEDMDSGFYSADYLRAWVTQAQLTKYLEQTYGERWFTNQEAGDFLKDLWAEGTKPENEDIARRIGATPHDPAALKEFFTELLPG